MRKEVIEKNIEEDRCGVNKKRGSEEKERRKRVVETMVLNRAVIEKEKQLLHRIAS